MSSVFEFLTFHYCDAFGLPVTLEHAKKKKKKKSDGNNSFKFSKYGPNIEKKFFITEVFKNNSFYILPVNSR